MNVPSGYTALDLVGFTDKGPYNSATAYVKNDIVHYGGNLWRCLVDDTTNVTPTEGANWTIYLSEPTSAAEDIIAPVEASAVSTRQYAVGKQLILNDTLYRVTAAVNIGDTLVVDTNIALSDTVVEQLATKANTSSLATVATSGSYVDLSNQPTLGTAAAKDVPTSGNASTTEVVMGDDTRLSDARNAADVYSWAKASTKPTYNGSEINTSAAQTGTAQSAVAATIASGTSMDAAVEDLLDNDVTLSSQISSVNEALTNEVETRATLGAHNLANLSLETIISLNTNGTWTGNKWTSPGSLCEFTVNTDTKGRITSIIADVKTVSAYNVGIVLGYGDFGNANIKTDENPTVNGYTISYGDTDTNFSFQYLGASGILRIVVAANTPISTKTMYPMICLEKDAYTGYAPYAMTNRELTENKAAKADLTNIDITGTTNNTGATITSGTYFYLNGTLVRAKTSIASNATFTLNTNYEVVTAGALNSLYSKGYFVVALVANTTKIISSTSDIVSGTLPSDFRESVFMISDESINNNFEYLMYCSGNRLFMKATVAQNYTVFWRCLP